MGIIEYYDLAEIIGSPTAGAICKREEGDPGPEMNDARKKVIS